MGWFGKALTKPGWMAFACSGEDLCAAKVVRTEGPPRVLQCLHFNNKIPMSLLEKMAQQSLAKQHVCTSLLSARHYQLLAVEAPNVPEAELKTAIRWRLKEMIDYPVDQATVDVIDIPMNKEAPVKVRNVFAAVARNQFIEQHQNAFAEADIPLTAIDLPEMAQRNISALAEPEGRGLAMLSFSDEGGLLTITFAGDLYLTRRIDVTFAQLLNPQADAQNASFDKITLELQRSLDHFDRQYHYVGLSKLMLAPLADAGPRLHAYLAANLYMPVEMLALDTLLDFSAVPQLQQSVEQQRFFLVLGAALRQDQVAS